MHAIASNGMRAAVEEMLPKMEKAAGGPIEFQYGTTTDLVRKIEAGQPFDIVIRRMAMQLPGFACTPFLEDFSLPVCAPALLAEKPVRAPADICQ